MEELTDSLNRWITNYLKETGIGSETVRTYFLRTETNLVVEVDTEQSHELIFKFYQKSKRRASNELQTYFFLLNKNVPIPRLVSYGRLADDIIPTLGTSRFIVVEKQKGQGIDRIGKKGKDELYETTKSVVDTLKKINSFKSKNFGRIVQERNPNKEIQDCYFDFEFREIPNMTSFLYSKNLLSSESRNELHEKLKSFKERINNIKKYCLVHGDFYADNIQIRDNKVASVFDWEMSYFGSFVNDLTITEYQLFKQERTGLDTETISNLKSYFLSKYFVNSNNEKQEFPQIKDFFSLKYHLTRAFEHADNYYRTGNKDRLTRSENRIRRIQSIVRGFNI